MRKKVFVSLFSVCILIGAAISLVNLKSVKSLASLNVEALTQRTWDGSPIGSKDLDTGTCGVLGISHGNRHNNYYNGYCSVCHAAYSTVARYMNSDANWTYAHKWCCDHCSSTTYCTDD